MQEQARAPAALFLPFLEPGQRPQLSTADTHTHTTHAHTRPTQRQHMGYMHTGRSHAKHKETTRIHAALLQRTARQPLPHRGRSQPSPWSPELRTEPHPSQPVCTLRSHGMGQHHTHRHTDTHTHTHGLQGQPTASPVQQVQPTSLRGREAPPHYSGEVSVSICFVHPPGGEHLENSSGFYP